MELVIRDFFFLGPSAGRGGSSSSDPNVRKTAQSATGLKVTFAASHAGKVNSNYVMYSPQGMKASLATWLEPSRRPVQIHHDDHADPIGRVVDARYVAFDGSTLESLSESQSDAALLLADAAGKDDILEAVDLLVDSGVLSDSSWRGVGELQLDAIVTDSAAIEKILDGRYETISISQRPKQAFCSICKRDWAGPEGPCDHARGKVDDEEKKKMFLVVGDTEYTEASYVNHPADKHAMNLKVEAMVNEETDEDKKMLFALDDSFEPEMQLVLMDSLENEPDIEDKPDESDSDPGQDPDDAPQDLDPPDDDGEEPSIQGTIEEALRVLFEDKDNLTEEDIDVINQALEDEVEEEDAKLSTKQRKKLPAKVFCGPNRSFPVNDCAHYTAAKRLLGKYKGPGDRSRILSCINGRGKALGCGGASKDEETDNTLCFTCMNDEDLVQAIKDGMEVFEAKGLDILSLLPSVVNSFAEKDGEIAGLKVRVEELESEIRSSEVTTSVLREEWKEMVVQTETADNTLSDLLLVLTDVLRDYALLVLTLSDKDSSVEDLEKIVREKSQDELKKLVKETNVSDEIALIRSGMSNEPEGSVTSADAKPEDVNKRDDVENEFLTRVQNLIKRSGRQVASSFIDGQVRRGNIVNEEVLAKAWELVAK